MRRLRRSELATPGSSPKMIAKAAGSIADEVFLDLEDAVSPHVRPEARLHVVDGLSNLDWGAKVRSVRINAITTNDGFDDLIAIVEGAGDHVDTVIVPKVSSATDVVTVDRFLTYLEHRHEVEKPIGLEILIETVEGLQAVNEIARASDRIETLILGVGDLAASQGARVAGEPPDEFVSSTMWLVARTQLVVAARAAGVEAIDGPFVNIRDIDGYARVVREARVMGFAGKWAIHPDQLAVANAGFAVQESELTWIEDVQREFVSSREAGTGAIALHGELIDAAHLLMADRLQELSDLVTERER